MRHKPAVSQVDFRYAIVRAGTSGLSKSYPITLSENFAKRKENLHYKAMGFKDVVTHSDDICTLPERKKRKDI